MPLESTLSSATYVPGTDVPRDVAVNKMVGKTKCTKGYIRGKYLWQTPWRWSPARGLPGPCLCLPCPQGRADWARLGQSDNRGLIRFRICLVSFFVSKVTGSCVVFHPEVHVCCSSFFDVSSCWSSVLNSINSLGVRETCPSAPRGRNQ